MFGKGLSEPGMANISRLRKVLNFFAGTLRNSSVQDSLEQRLYLFVQIGSKHL